MDNYILTDEIIKPLKCSLCELLLSMPPITIISEDGQKYKCGRCQEIRTHRNTRAIMYENLAKHMLFPCSYNECPEKLRWDDVQQHEESCSYRTYLCPKETCEEHLAPKDFCSHFKTAHNEVYHSNFLRVSQVYSYYSLDLLVKDEKPYIVIFDHDELKYGISLCSLGPEPDDSRYTVTLTSENGKYSMLISDQPIVRFNERIHCFKCVKGVCKSEFHLYKYYKKGVLKHMVTKIERKAVREMFCGSRISYNVNIAESKKEEEELEDCFLEKDMIIDEVNDEEELPEEPDNNTFKEKLECPGCKQKVEPPIHQCLTGHIICAQCKRQLENCPVCEEKIEHTRNYTLEEVVEGLRAISTIGKVPETSETPSEDLTQEIMCPKPNCHDKFELQTISAHFKEKHIENFHWSKLAFSNVLGYYNIEVLLRNGKTYVVLFDFDDLSIGVSVCSLEQLNYQYEIKLSSEKGNCSLQAKHQDIIQFKEKEHCFKCISGNCKNNEHLYKGAKKREIYRKLTTRFEKGPIKRIVGASSANPMNYLIVINEKDMPREILEKKDRIFRQMFECPICKDYMLPPIFQCLAGHTLCNTCRPKLEHCPTCGEKIEKTRNYALEEMSESIELPCQYENESCQFRSGLKRISIHELDCPLKSKKMCIKP